jgi:hypothetical protein
MTAPAEVRSETKIISPAGGGKVDRGMAWPVVTIVAIVTLVTGGLIAFDKDATTLLVLVSAVVVPVLAAFGISELRTLKSNTNGMSTRMQNTNDQLVALLAKQLNRSDTTRPGDEPLGEEE